MSQTITSTGSKTTMIVGDQSLDVANLEEIQLERIIAKDEVEIAKLLKASEVDGFYYLTFGDDLSERVSSYLKANYLLQHEYFSQPLEEKMKTFQEDAIHGYKRAGIESYEIRRDIQNEMTLPSPFTENAQPTLDLANICDYTVRTLLSAYSESLGLDLESSHNGPSDSGIKFVSGPTKERAADMPDTTHTDGGSITLLWCEKWATQIRTKDTKEWLWVDPKPNRVLVNVADYLEKQSSGRLHSPAHRVCQPFDGAVDRYFVSYFLRPNYF